MSKFSNKASSHPDENHLLGQEETSLKIRGESKIKLYDYVLKNDEFEKAVQIIMTIIENEKRIEDSMKN